MDGSRVSAKESREPNGTLAYLLTATLSRRLSSDAMSSRARIRGDRSVL